MAGWDMQLDTVVLLTHSTRVVVVVGTVGLVVAGTVVLVVVAGTVGLGMPAVRIPVVHIPDSLAVYRYTRAEEHYREKVHQVE